jgi:hypothetical protein
MITLAEDILLERCKREVIQKIGWDSSENWSNRDFDELSEIIFNRTGVSLSNITLKRLWGKVKYDSAPTTRTLDTLAQFIDFENWRAYRQSLSVPNGNEKKEITAFVSNISESETENFTKYKRVLLSIGLISILSMVIFVVFNKNQTNINPNDYSFSSKKIVQSGLPNTVIFDYDASKAPLDNVSIQQSWDSTLRKKVPRNLKQHTSIYYTPGYFNAKLLVGDKIVKENDVFIKSNGWLPLIETKPVPIYFKENDVVINGEINLPITLIKAQNLNLQPNAPYVRYSNVQDFGEIRTDNFAFETRLKNDFREGASICQKTIVTLLCEGSAINIPLNARGCVSESTLFYLGKRVSGKENDLSGFGVDFSDFVTLRCEVKNNFARFFIDKKLVYQLDYSKEKDLKKKKIVGIDYRFQGAGIVKTAKLFDKNGNVVFDGMI